MGRWFVELPGLAGLRASRWPTRHGARTASRASPTGARPTSKHDYIVLATPLGVTDAILRELALRRPRGRDLRRRLAQVAAARGPDGAEVARLQRHLRASDVRARHRAAVRAARGLRRPGLRRGARGGARAVRADHGRAGGDESRRPRPADRLRARPVARAQHRVLHRARRERRGRAEAGAHVEHDLRRAARRGEPRRAGEPGSVLRDPEPERLRRRVARGPLARRWSASARRCSRRITMHSLR